MPMLLVSKALASWNMLNCQLVANDDNAPTSSSKISNCLQSSSYQRQAGEAGLAFWYPILCLAVTYFAAAGFFHAMTVHGGNWHRFRITTLKKPKAVWSQIQSSAVDLLLIMPTAYRLLESRIVRPGAEPMTWQSLARDCTFTGFTVFSGYVWRMLVHRGMHHPALYKYLHKRHHVPLYQVH